MTDAELSDRDLFITDAIQSAEASGLRVRIGWITGMGAGMVADAADVRVHKGGIVIDRSANKGKEVELWAPFAAILNVGVERAE